jgi:hypothetical protein
MPKGARIAVRAATLIFGSVLYWLGVLAGFYLLGFLFLFGDCLDDQCRRAQEAARSGIWTFLVAAALFYVVGLALLVWRWRRKKIEPQG